MRKSIEEQRKSQEEENGRPSITIARKPLPPPSVKHPLPPLPQEAPYQPPVVSQDYRNKSASASGPLRLDTGPDFGINRKHFSSSPQPPSLFEASGDYAISPTVPDNRSVYSTNHGGGNGAQMTPDNRSMYSTTHGYGTGNGAPTMSDNRSVYSMNYGHGNGPSSDTYNPSVHRNPSPPQPDVMTPLELARRIDPTFPPVTIIRRDPTSGSQWNIGTISLLQPTFTGSPLRPVHVELTAPGYVRFNKADFSRPRRGSGASDAASVRRAIESLATSPASAISPDFPTHPFARIVDFRKMALADLKRTVYQRTNSSDSIGRIPHPSKPNAEKNVLAFDSPWNGTCTFINGIDGKTLKLKHTIQSPSSPTSDSSTANLAELRFNLGWSVLGNVKTHRHRSVEPDKLPISDLLESKKENFRKSFQHLRHKSRESFQRIRANDSHDENYDQQNEDVFRNLSNIRTPTTNNISAPNSAYPPSRTPPYQQHNHLAVNSVYPYDQSDRISTHPTSSENEEEEGRISLKLGRERAGGGFRGHSAKLGKLVIEDEGLKMCDLVVGTAMGVWWQHYGIE